MPARDTRLVTREERRHDRDRLAQRGERPLLLDPEPVEPRALRETEERAPSETASSIAICPAISYGCSVNGFSAAGPSRIRSVTRAMSRSGPIAGWSRRSW